MSASACKGRTALFYPPLDDELLQSEIIRTNRSREHNRAKRVRAAKVICADCPVRWECLSWGLREGSNLQEPITGGMTWYERKGWLRQFRDAVRAENRRLIEDNFVWVESSTHPDSVCLQPAPHPEVSVDVRSSVLSMVS